MSDSALAFEQLRLADGRWESALRASALAPPDPGFAERIRAIASAAEQEAAAFRTADGAGLAWPPLPAAREMNLSYELRRNGRRPGPVELWERFDAAVGELGAALEGVALSAIARAFINLADIAHTLADEIESIHSSLSGSRPTVRDVAKKYKAVRRALVDAGWSVVRQQGSHEVWAHPDRDERIVVAGKDSDTVPVGTLGSIRRASGLEHLR